jgi:16S rRNA (uracil1498-N3)-methyltransferase
MRTPRLYTDIDLAVQTQVQLPPRTGHYLTRVLRRGTNDKVTLFNGDGNEYEAIIKNSHRGIASLEVLQCIKVNRESPLRLHLGLVMSKGDRMDWAVQKATELGVSALTPLNSEFCDVKLNAERLEKKRQHWQQIAISACEQSGRNKVPTIHPIEAFDRWLEATAADLHLIFDASGVNRGEWKATMPKSVLLLVGPEGGFSSNELSQATGAGFKIAALGPRIMRTETVPVAAITLAQHLWGDL